MIDIISMGVIIMDMFPGEKGVAIGDMPFWVPVPGGAPANVAVGAAKLGVSSAFVGKLGDDAFGRRLLDALRAEGVDVSGVRFDPDARTTMNFHAKPREGELEYLFYRNPGADTRIAPEELDPAMFANVKAYHFDSMSLTHEPERSATREAIRLTRRAGGIVSFDVNYRLPVWRDERHAVDVALEWAQSADLMKLNETELALVCPGVQPERAAKELLERGPSLVLVTLGERGVLYAARGFSGQRMAFRVETVDSIGCGDGFISAFLAGYVGLGKPLAALDQPELDALVFRAQAAAAITATRQGVIPALPTLAELEDFVRGRQA